MRDGIICDESWLYRFSRKMMKVQIPDEKILVRIHYLKLFFPSTYSVSNGDEFVLTMSACTPFGIALYTEDKWIPIRDELLANTSDIKAQRELTRRLIGNAENCIVEDGGIRISPHLMKKADLHREAVWIQCANRVEIWNPKISNQCSQP
jgi:DNA-binding transcriptional regulator/RsmH inhibitor MraZ